MEEIRVIDNFLSEQSFSEIKHTFENNLPWYFGHILNDDMFVDDQKYNMQLVHQFLSYWSLEDNSIPEGCKLKIFDQIQPQTKVKVKKGHIVQYTSDYYSVIEPILKRIGSKDYTRIKANLTAYNPHPVQGGFHVDRPEDVDKDSRTAVYYINTNNGGTEFELGEFIESVENRMVIFPCRMMHQGVGATDSKVRMVLNINWKHHGKQGLTQGDRDAMIWR